MSWVLVFVVFTQPAIYIRIPDFSTQRSCLDAATILSEAYASDMVSYTCGQTGVM